MPKENDIPFYSIIKETFGSVFEEYGFEIQEKRYGLAEGNTSLQPGKLTLG